MIPPYNGPLVFHLGPLNLPLFGVLVATGVLIGHSVVLKVAQARGIPAEEMRTAAAWALAAGFFGAHAFDVLLYHPEKLSRDGALVFLKVWDGISSFGGFFGALAGLSLYFAALRKTWWAHADALVQGLVVGWVFGRLGCTLTSDHIGIPSRFVLAFSYAAGPRHNVGFYEFLYTVFVLVPLVELVRWRELVSGYRPGIYVAAVCAAYAPARFLLDFLRATDIPGADTRYLGFTAAQYASLAMFAMAVALLQRLARTTPRRARA